MKLGELAIEIGVKSDTKKLKETLKHMKELESKISRQISKERELAKATTDEEKALIKKKYALQENIKKTEETINKQQKFSDSIKGSIRNIRNIALAVAGTVTALDRMGNSLLKNNQTFTTFNRTTGIGIDRLNKTTTIAQLSGMNMSPEQVMGDLKGMQQRIFQLGLEGGDTKIFQMLGFNPMGKKPEQIIEALRRRAKTMNAQQLSYALDQLGLSQEWVNVLVMGDKQYERLQKKSKELNLSEEQRRKLAMLTARQQENNMRFAKIRDEFLIAILPHIQKIMEWVAKVTQNLIEDEGKLKQIGTSLGNIAKIMLAISAINLFKNSLLGAKGLLAMLSGGGLLELLGGKAIGKGVAKTGLGKVLGGIGLKTAGKFGAKMGLRAAGMAIPGLNILMGGWLIWDLIQAGKSIKDALSEVAETIQDGAEDFEQAEEDMENMLSPVESNATSFLNRNIKAMFTNNFYNNPQPAGQVSSEMATLINRYAGA